MDVALGIGLAILMAPVPLSMTVDARRKKPSAPDALVWDHSVALCLAKDFTVYAMDYPGHRCSQT